MSGRWTLNDVEDEIQLAMQHGDWFTAAHLRKRFADCPDLFWAAMGTLYRAKAIERAFDVHGATIYRLVDRYE
jgi:hypothetical protein